jgi:putative protease
LSLKDLSLAAHVPALLDAGVSSLKIEGRMKSPGYVGGVTAIWRRLLDERRAATPEEMAALGDLFSRGGFTDGYQTGKITRSMMGIRSDSDKERTAAAEKAATAAKYPPHLPVSMTLTARRGDPVTLTAEAPLYRQGCAETVSVTVAGEPMGADELAPLSDEAVEKQLTRTGGTAYRAESIRVQADEALRVPLSRLNALRREALERLDEARLAAMPDPAAGYTPVSVSGVVAEMGKPEGREAATDAPLRTARFYTPEQITPAAADYFDLLYLPLGKTHPACVPAEKRGVLLPPVVFDSEAEAVSAELAKALGDRIRHLLVSNIGHLPLVQSTAEGCGIDPDSLYLHGDLRLNTANTPAAARLTALGFRDLILSPELTLPRMRDVGAGLTRLGSPNAAGAVVYGRLPLMLLEKCAIREVYRHMKPDAVCREICGRNGAVMRDRMGKDFPILREDSPCGRGHRNLVCNSLPTGMSDRGDELARAALGGHHFIFTVESPAQVDHVIEAYRRGRPLGGEVRRMLK